MLFTGGITSTIAENLRKTRLNFGKERIVHKIFIVEDDPVIARLVAEQLERWGYEAVCARDFAHVLEEFVAAAPQLVLLDIRLPSYSGYHWCSQIRRVSRVPVIFLSSAADNLNQVMALSLGADDFIAKPFDLDLLLAKIQALLRRTYEFGGEGRLIQHRGAVLDLDSASLTYGGRRAELTKNEFGILRILMENRGRTVSREDLMSRLWQTDCYVDENTLTVNVARLRRKLEGLGLTDFILTKKGMGYLVE